MAYIIPIKQITSETILKIIMPVNVLTQHNRYPIVLILGISLNADIPTIIDNITTPTQKGHPFPQVLSTSFAWQNNPKNYKFGKRI